MFVEKFQILLGEKTASGWDFFCEQIGVWTCLLEPLEYAYLSNLMYIIVETLNI